MSVDIYKTMARRQAKHQTRTEMRRRVRRLLRERTRHGEMTIAATEAPAAEIKFGSVSLRVVPADAQTMASNVAAGQRALKRGASVLTSPGVDLKATKGVPRYVADPKKPDQLIQILNGKRTRGVFRDGRFAPLE